MTFLYVAPFWIALPLLVAAALRWGAWPERATAILLAVFALISLVVRSPGIDRYLSVEYREAVADLCLTVALLWIAIRTDRWWTIFTVAFQVVATLAHAARAVDPAFSRLAYSLMAGSSSYPTLLALAAGIWSRRRRNNAAVISNGSSPAPPSRERLRSG